MLRKLAFSVLGSFGTGFAIVALWKTLATDDSLSRSYILTALVEAVSYATGLSFVIAVIFLLAMLVFPRILRRFTVWVTLRTVCSAISRLSIPIDPDGIAEIEGDVGIGLRLGSQDGLSEGDRFLVVNTTNQRKWGILQVHEIRKNSCICLVLDRTNPEFWDALEARMREDPSPSQGVTIRRALSEEFLMDRLSRLLNVPRG